MTSDNPKIIVPIGFSEQSMIALDQAVHLAEAINAEITLLSVFEESGTLRKLFSDSEEQFLKLKKNLTSNLEDVASKYSSSPVQFRFMVNKGKVYEEIVNAADSIGAAFIVMGTDGKPGQMKKRFIGSNAYRVMTTAHCPIITIKGTQHREGCKNIVLPLDLMKETKEKVGHATRLAKVFGATIHAVSVLDTSDAFKKNKLKRNLKQVERFIATEKQLPVTAKAIKPAKGDNVAKTIVKYAEEKQADLIMIMTQQEDPITKYFLGSAAQEMIYSSMIPVMSIRPKPRKSTAVFDLP